MELSTYFPQDVLNQWGVERIDREIHLGIFCWISSTLAACEASERFPAFWTSVDLRCWFLLENWTCYLFNWDEIYMVPGVPKFPADSPFIQVWNDAQYQPMVRSSKASPLLSPPFPDTIHSHWSCSPWTNKTSGPKLCFPWFSYCWFHLPNTMAASCHCVAAPPCRLFTSHHPPRTFPLFWLLFGLGSLRLCGCTSHPASPGLLTIRRVPLQSPPQETNAPKRNHGLVLDLFLIYSCWGSYARHLILGGRDYYQITTIWKCTPDSLSIKVS
jgi:hypothetical protein